MRLLDARNISRDLLLLTVFSLAFAAVAIGEAVVDYRRAKRTINGYSNN